jgi:Chaperone of endosialidase
MRNTYIKFKPVSLLLLFILSFFFSRSQDIADATIKKNISAIVDPLQKLIQLSPKSFEYDHKAYKHLKLQPGTQYGFIAEDLQAIFPSLVKERSVSYMFGKNAYRQTKIKVIDEASLIPVLVAAIKEQQIAIENLKTEIQGLKKDQAMSR